MTRCETIAELIKKMKLKVPTVQTYGLSESLDAHFHHEMECIGSITVDELKENPFELKSFWFKDDNGNWNEFLIRSMHEVVEVEYEDETKINFNYFYIIK